MENFKEHAKQWAINREKEAETKKSQFGKKPMEQKPIQDIVSIRQTEILPKSKLQKANPVGMQKLSINKNVLLKKYTQNSTESKGSRGFTQLPNSIPSDERLTRSDMLVYWAIKSHNYKGKEYCYPSLQRLSKKAHCSKNTVIKSVKNLEKLGYIRVDRRRHKKEKSNCYYILSSPP